MSRNHFRQLIGTRVHEQFELNVVGVPKHQRGSKAHINDSGVRYAFRVQMRDPSFQFALIRDPEGKVIEADAPFIERVA
jgi:hypothetical protein